MHRKVIWGFIVIVFVAGVAYLGLSTSKTLATTDAGKITQEEYYDKVKSSSAGKQVFAQMVIDKVLEKHYGSQVSKSDVTNAYTTAKAQYGDSFATMLTQSGLTDTQYKESLREKLVMNAAVKANYKISKDKLNDAYNNYVPETTISLITAKDQDTAQQAIDALNNGTSWDDVYKQYSSKNTQVNKSGQLPAFDSTNTTVDSEIRKAAFNQDAGSYSSSPVKPSSGSNYYVVRTDKMASKPAESKVEQKLKDRLTSDFLSDSNNATEIQKIVGKILRKDDVSIKDSDLKNSLSGYLTAGV
ncbi:peptidylprolyl isomerase [Fructobacillus cardui]|uniref:Foldase protein PrsA n=1 Tax=Fructobacillus cardui TaxID=2893170 RepID=A0ABN9YMH2_9LACO|nr:Peptidyl-prolyl isomerase [Fructobacillus cardui]CAK1232820.1 Peptidyl-prolyl isomerase [Fructobacillus cardui]CAK1236785.1 Peptidyl-prolyl isomerase [Fructobacillus cardui]